LLLLLLLLLLGVTTRDATRDGAFLVVFVFWFCRVLCPFFFVFCVFLSCVTDRERERAFLPFLFREGTDDRREKKKSKKKKSCCLCEKGKKIQIDHSSSFF
jgi:hypothetical protein